MDSDVSWIRVAALKDFGESRRLVREVAGLSILLCRLGEGVVAVRNVCTHLGKPLEAGRIMAGHITCPFHGACFDLRTGTATSGPAVAPLRCFAVRIQDQDVLLKLVDP